VDHHAGAEPERPVEASHPLGVAAGQVVVHRDHVDAAAGERVQVAGQRGDEGLSLAGLHLGDLALVEHVAADELDVEVAHPQGAEAGLPGEREGLREQLVERPALLDLLLPLGGEPGELLGAERLHPGLELVHAHHHGGEALELALVLRPHDLAKHPVQHRFLVGGAAGPRPRGT